MASLRCMNRLGVTAPTIGKKLEMDDVLVAQRRLQSTEAELETAFCTEQTLAAQLAAAEATSQTSLTEASQQTEEAVERLSQMEMQRAAAAHRLNLAEGQVERKIQEAEAQAEEASASLLCKHQMSQRRVEEDFETFKVEMESRAEAAEELVAAMQDERSLMMCGGLSALRGEALEARLNMSRQRITEACTAREAADKREALAATAYRQALAAEEEAAQEAVAEGQRESRLHEERAATEVERFSTRGAAAKVEADTAERDATKEVEALWEVARQRCQTSEEQEQRWKTEILESTWQGTSRTAERLRVAEVHAAQIWCESQKQIAKVLKDNEQEVQAAQAACAAHELAAATEGQQLKTELHERLQMIRSEEQEMDVEWTKALNAIEAKQHQDHEDAAQRICAAEHLESCLWAEELAVEEEVYAFEIEEEEAASRILAELEVHQSEAAAQRNARAEESEEALRPMLMALEAAEHRAFKACQMAEEAERGFHEEAANSLSSAESQERQLQLQRKRLEEEVVEAKNMAQKRIGDEEEKSRVLQLEVQFATEQRSRACWEEICAENFQAAQRMEAIREQEEFLSTQAEELLDDAAHTEVATQKMREAQLTEENAAQGLREAVTEVELALQQILQDCKDQEEAIAQKARLAEVEICEEEVQQLSLAESRWQSAEVRAEMASQRCNDAMESTASTKLRYQLEMHELHKKGEKKEASVMAKLLAAEQALSTSLWWCNKQGQIGLKIFTAEELASNMVEVDGDRSPKRADST